ncbi:YqcC family protein [Gynuella sp.]|uniref:YqcC family protein n=1 Tax=Gynuella sp. TaxID=2969146 RepID=UPI003D0F826A
MSLTNLLAELENELKHLDYWRAFPPDPQAFMSEQPFCVDTMELHQWLQFVFIARLNALLEGNLPLPSASGVYPMAEQVFGENDRHERLLKIIDAIDGVLGRASQ